MRQYTSYISTYLTIISFYLLVFYAILRPFFKVIVWFSMVDSVTVPISCIFGVQISVDECVRSSHISEVNSSLFHFILPGLYEACLFFFNFKSFLT